MPILLLLRANDRADWIDKIYPLTWGSFSWMPHTSKYFKLLNFLAPQSRDWIAWVVETERHCWGLVPRVQRDTSYGLTS
jgi:hypothetical protein